MKKSLVVLLFLSQIYLSAAQIPNSWLPAAQQIPIAGSGDTGVGSDIIMAFYPKNNTVVATWGDVGYTTLQHPFYAVYNGTTWTTAAPIPLTGSTSTGVFDEITVAYYPKNQTIIAAWNDANFPFFGYYAVFDGNTWSVPQQIDLQQGPRNLRLLDNIYMTYYPPQNVMVAAYGLGIFPTYLPYYTTYDGTSWTTSQPIPIPAGGTINDDVHMAYDSANQTILGAWGDFHTHLPYYSIYKNGTWTTNFLTPVGASNGVHFDVDVVYDPINDRTVAIWADTVIPHLPYYTFYHNGSWSTPQVLPLGASTGAAYDINVAYDGDSQTVFATWSNSDPTLFAAGLPYFSILNGPQWTEGAIIKPGTSLAAQFNVNLVFDPSSHQMIGAWSNYLAAPFDPSFPYYSTYFTLPLPAPTQVRVVMRENRFLSQSEISAQIFWQPSTAISIAGYRIYKNGRVIATVPATARCYINHNTRFGNTYQVSAFNSSGIESALITATP